MLERGETLVDIEASTLDDAALDLPFDAGLGSVGTITTGGAAFTVWTAKTVYFPVAYDDSEWVGCVSRHPDGAPTKHQGS